MATNQDCKTWVQSNYAALLKQLNRGWLGGGAMYSLTISLKILSWHDSVVRMCSI